MKIIIGGIDRTNAATVYLQELKKKKVSVLYPLRRKYSQFIKSLEELNDIELDQEDPVGGLRKEAQRIIDRHPYIFWLNSKTMLLHHKFTVAPFEKNWGKPIRKVYRTRLSEILKGVNADKNGLSSETKTRILKEVKAEYESMAGRDNIFRRYPCREGVDKIALKIEGINEVLENIDINQQAA